MKNPKRDIPIVLLIIAFIGVVLYANFGLKEAGPVWGGTPEEMAEGAGSILASADMTDYRYSVHSFGQDGDKKTYISTLIQSILDNMQYKRVYEQEIPTPPGVICGSIELARDEEQLITILVAERNEIWITCNEKDKIVGAAVYTLDDTLYSEIIAFITELNGGKIEP